MSRLFQLLLASALVALVAGCSEDPPCPAGELGEQWQGPPLSGLVPSDVHVCRLPEEERATHAQFWVETSVHRANMDNVDRAQGSGWNRISDNWYSTSGDYESPKWSEFSNESGALRLDVREANGGALVDFVYTPNG